MTTTFDTLTETKKKDLDRLMESGAAPRLSELTGFEFRGYNHNPVTVLSNTRKFKKGFYGDASRQRLWGYNVPVQQNAKSGPWVSTGGPYYFFGVIDALDYKKPKYTGSTIVDYGMVRSYAALNPVQLTVDYLVYPDHNNANLILDKSYGRTLLGEVFLGYFTLERHSESQQPTRNVFFEDHEIKTLRAFAEAYFLNSPIRLTPDEIARNIDRQISLITSNRTQSFKLVLNVIEHLLPTLTGFGKSFSKLNVSRRRVFLDQVLAKGHRGEIGDLLRDLSRMKALMSAGYYSDSRVHQDIGFQKVEDRVRYQPDLLRPQGAPEIIVTRPQTARLDADICVIGSGAAGAVIAANAAMAGKDVVLIEEGPYVQSKEMNHDEGSMTSRLYKEGGLQTSIDFDMTILQGKCLGGTTVVNNAICFRHDDSDLTLAERSRLLDRWKVLGASIDESSLRESYERVELKLNVQRIGSEISGGNASVLLEGLRTLQASDPSVANLRSGRFKKNFSSCLGCGHCNFGCPYDRKLSMLETYVPLACKNNGRIVSDCHAKRLEHSNGVISALHCLIGKSQALEIRARKFIISCGTIGSSMLLWKSGITKNVGTAISFNAATPVFAWFERSIVGFDGVQMGAFIDSEEYMLESLFNPPMTFAMTLPGWFETHFQRMTDYNRLACAGVLIGTDNKSRLKPRTIAPDLTGPLELRLTHDDLSKLKNGMATLARVFFAAGATEVFPALFENVTLKRDALMPIPSLQEIKAILDRHIKDTDDLVLSSAHPQGGNPMSDDAAKGVVRSDFLVHGFSNLYVCDASVFPTTINVNPQLTIMALADYAWNNRIGR